MSFKSKVLQYITFGSAQERLKFYLLTLSFFLIIGAYTLVRELKNSLFMAVVGTEYIPWVRLLVMIGLIPAILFYSFLVDRLRRYQLLYFYTIFYGITGLICTYLIGHPVIGLINTDASPWRLFGWFFYFFIEGFSPFVISVFWSFANSIYNPDQAKESYALIVTGSKLGGMTTAGIAWFIFSLYEGTSQRMFSHVVGHQILLAIFSCLVLIIPVVVYYLIKKVPGKYLHGYEAAYQFEKERKKAGEKQGVLAGLILLLKFPYILGIFGMLFFYEVISTVLSYHRLGVAQAISTDISGISCFLFKTAFIQHFFGLLISFIGTRTLLHFFGEKTCLLLIPAITAPFLVFFTWSYSPVAVVAALVMLQAVNYAFAQPVRESLYIPTVKDIKFKSKSWIDAFGSRFAKGVGSNFNIVANCFGPAYFFLVHAFFFGGILALWAVAAYFLGRRYEKAIENNEVIGQEESGSADL